MSSGAKIQEGVCIPGAQLDSSCQVNSTIDVKNKIMKKSKMKRGIESVGAGGVKEK